MDKQLRRILELIRKTGDRMVVTDTNGDDVYVVMGLEQYESLVDSSFQDDEDDLCEDWWNDQTGLDKPNVGSEFSNEIPEHELDQNASRSSEINPPSDIWDAMQTAGTTGATWDINKLSEVEKSDLERQFQEYRKIKTEELIENKEEKAQESKKDEDFGEEQFYLEPLE